MRQFMAVLLVGGVGLWHCHSDVARATVIHVPGNQPTIQAGIDAAVSGDTVLVAPGTYHENLRIVSTPINLMSEEGPATTILQASYAESVRLYYILSDTCRIVGFGFRNTGIQWPIEAERSLVCVENCEFVDVYGPICRVTFDPSHLVIRNNLFMEQSPQEPFVGIAAESGARLTVERNVFYSLSKVPTIAIADAYPEVVNNTMLDCVYGIAFGDAIGGIALNNIFSGIEETALSVGGTGQAYADYNCFFNNGTNTAGVEPGDSALFSDPQVTNPASLDFSLTTTSPCIGAGNPLPQYNDPDGSRNDVGAYPRLCTCDLQSDFDEDWFITALDLASLIDILFIGSPDIQDPWCPSPRGDLDCDGFSTALDLSGLIDHLFAGGVGPCSPCERPRQSSSIND